MYRDGGERQEGGRGGEGERGMVSGRETEKEERST